MRDRTAHVFSALSLCLWYAAHDDDADGERQERLETAAMGLRAYWLDLTPDQQQAVQALFDTLNLLT